MLETTTVFTVWGPTAEWGDGSGPLAYFPTEEQANSYIDFEVADLLDNELENTWPYNQVEFTVLEQQLEDVLDEETLVVAVNDWDEDELFEHLNTR